MRICVTGATGFVGLNVVEALLKRGEHVVAFDKSPMPKDAKEAFSSLQGSIELVEGDICDYDSVFRSFSGCTALIHGAAITSGLEREQRDAHSIVDVNINGTINAMKAAREIGIGRIVHFSSASVYGDSAFQGELLQECISLPLPNSLYGITKYAGERIALNYRETYGLNLVCLRPGYVFGPWERNTGVRDTLSPILQVSVAAARGEEVVLPRPCTREWAYSRDIANATLALLYSSEAKGPVYNASGPEPWALEHWCRLLAQKFPNFSYRIGQDFNIELNTVKDRDPLDLSLLEQDTLFVPCYGLEQSYQDYTAWMDGQLDFSDTPI